MNRKNGDLKKLSDMLPSESGKIVSVGGNPDIRRVMMAMGLTPGASVRFRKTAPLGDPIEIRIRGYELSVRKKEAAAVLVSVDTES